MPASIFNGDSVKILKDKLKFKSGNKIISGSSDPTVVSADGEVGDIYLNVSGPNIWIKTDSGPTNAWNLIIDETVLAIELANFIALTEKGAANGVATLGADGKLTASEIPAIAITNTFVVASQVAQTGLTAEVGDVAVRTDESKSYILVTEPASSFANWQELLSPTDAVLSVFSRTGIVTAQSGDYSANQITNVPSGNLAAIDVQAALNELQTELDGAANKTLSNLTSPTSVNESLIPAVNSTQDLGSTAKRFQDIYASSLKDASGNIVLNQQNRQLSDSAGNPSLTFSSATEINANSRKLINVANPTSAQDAATKDYVDNTIGSIPPTVQKFLSGSGTYTTPTSPKTPLYIKVRILGGGGGGSGADSSGGNNGTAGTATTFSTLSAGGGAGGIWNGGGGAGGTNTVGVGWTNVAATTGSGGGTYSGGVLVGNIFSGGSGGAGALGGKGADANYASTGAAGTANTGSGGQGGGSNNVAGIVPGSGGGAGGYVEAIYPSPTGTFTYTVGGGGTGGGGGGGGTGGGAGGSGIIIVEEFYQ